ncbi:MAG: hypothetical protein AB1631_15255 [Acidobacteriota bacterium]
MECKDFESLIIDLARDRLVEAAKRDLAVAHARECRVCAARLTDERALARGLAALAASDAHHEAPRRVEEALLAAFRNRAVASPSRRVRWIRIAAAAAAAIIIIAALVWSQQPEATDHQAVPSKDESPPIQNERDQKLKELEPVIGTNEHAPKPQPKRRGSQLTKASLANSDRAASTENEVAMDFLPLVEYDNLINFESGEIRRVMLSRSALVSLGLPVNMDRANEPVKADVLVGHDGLARAIRFVR